MCWFYMGIAQIALAPRPQTILASPDTPEQMWEKVPQTILASLYTPPPLTGNAHMETIHFKKGLP